jgi:hypothetical protein
MKSLPQPKLDFLMTVSERIVPQVAELDDGARRRMLAIIDRALSDRPDSVRRQFGTFLAVIKWAPVARYAAPFHRLPDHRRDAFLRWLEDCPVRLIRTGMWGLKSLVFMGFYGRSEVWDEIGYRPAFDSRERLHA